VGLRGDGLLVREVCGLGPDAFAGLGAVAHCTSAPIVEAAARLAGERPKKTPTAMAIPNASGIE
jgi:hypothetical protein